MRPRATLLSAVADVADGYIGWREGEYHLLCPAHHHPEVMCQAIAEAIEGELYARSLRGRIAVRWWRLYPRLPYGLCLVLCRAERDQRRAYRRGEL